jgi:CRISPR-associated endoribonuclease Cas6
MITQVKIPILAPDNFRITPDMAYNLYGTWMSLLAPEQSDYLHQSRAMNHYLLPNGKNSAVLTVNLLAEETADFMIPLFEKTREYHLTKYNCTLAAQEPQMQRFGEDDFVKPYFTSPRFHRRVTLHLMTPTTFKTKNHYAVFPTPELILQSAAAKWNTLGSGVTVDDEQTILQLMESTMITDYRLKSEHYCLKNARIQSFSGSVTLYIHGPEPMVRLFDMLLGALRFTGLGIKTALGMGGVII